MTTTTLERPAIKKIVAVEDTPEYIAYIEEQAELERQQDLCEKGVEIG